jgi:hypothetical protein
MKRLIFLMLVILGVFTFTQAGIVRNGSTTGEDSLSVPLFVLDSIGNRAELDTAGDWGYIVSRYPNGGVADSDSFLIKGTNTAKIIKAAAQFGGFAQFAYRRPIATLDGTPTNGTYSYEVTVRDSSLKLWTVVKSGEFQLYQTRTYTDALDSLPRLADLPTITQARLDSLGDVPDFLKIIDANGYIYATCDSCREYYFTTTVGSTIYTDSIYIYKVRNPQVLLGKKIYYRGVDNILDSTRTFRTWVK